MSGVDRQLLNSAPDDMDVDKILADLGLGGLPYRDRMSLFRHKTSLQMTVPSDAWKAAGHDIEDPGSVDLFWFKDEDLLIVDLSND